MWQLNVTYIITQVLYAILRYNNFKLNWHVLVGLLFGGYRLTALFLGFIFQNTRGFQSKEVWMTQVVESYRAESLAAKKARENYEENEEGLLGFICS